MTDENFYKLLKDVLKTDIGFYFISELLERLGAFERGCNFDNQYIEYYNRGKREKALWLLDLVKDNDIEAFTKIIKNRR